MPKKHGRPIITDFGEARFGQAEYGDDIQPFQYRAPEVVFGLPWSYKVDIWNVGVLVRMTWWSSEIQFADMLQIWDLFEGKDMFKTEGPNGEDSSLHHVAHMIALLGPPPADLLRRTPRTLAFFDTTGEFIIHRQPRCILSA